jgi:hypothetical protein
MVKRILNPDEFDQLLDDIFELFQQENSTEGHVLLQHDKKCIQANFSNRSILAWDFFVWGHLNNGKFDAVIAFINDKNVKFGTATFNEFIWLSKNPIAGYKLFSEAVKFARANKFSHIISHTVVNNPHHEKVKSFYKKMGFLKDSETYICKL